MKTQYRVYKQTEPHSVVYGEYSKEELEATRFIYNEEDSAEKKIKELVHFSRGDEGKSSFFVMKIYSLKGI